MGFLYDKETGDAVYFDATQTETIDDPSLITEHIVETGSPLADHQRIQPITVSLRVVATDTPSRDFPDDAINRPLKGATASIDLPNGRKATATSYGAKGEDPIDISGLTWLALREWRDGFVPLRLVSPKRVIDNLLIKDISVQRDRPTSKALSFNITLTEVRFAATQQVSIKRMGKLPKEDVGPEDPKNSVAKKIGDGLYAFGKTLGVVK